MFELSFIEILFIAIVAVLLLGPKEMMELARQLLKTWHGISATLNEVRGQLHEAVEESGVKEIAQELKPTADSIIDLDGNVQQTYDLSDVLEPKASQSDSRKKPDAS